jgi:ABC-type Zn uptake system ZnuABC Zn-binding protein ZnuA
MNSKINKMKTYNKSQVNTIARMVVLAKPTSAEEFQEAFENAIATVDEATENFTDSIYPVR